MFVLCLFGTNKQLRGGEWKETTMFLPYMFFSFFSLCPDKDSILRLWHFGFSLYTLLFRFCLQLWQSSRFPISHKFSKHTEQFLQLLVFNSFSPFCLFAFSPFHLFYVCEFPFWLFVSLLFFVPLPIFVFFFHSSLPVFLVEVIPVLTQCVK